MEIMKESNETLHIIVSLMTKSWFTAEAQNKVLSAGLHMDLTKGLVLSAIWASYSPEFVT